MLTDYQMHTTIPAHDLERARKFYTDNERRSFYVN